jgi:8-oxo-dGTP pyrophosphatase MutT (NUDIX family)
MEDRLRRALSRWRKARIADSTRIAAAVLIPLYVKEGEYHIMFIQRSNRVRDHKGQISFPGGAYEEGDETLLRTALREADEEVGLDPETVTVLGEIDDIRTIGSGYVVSPFVGVIPWPYEVRVDKWETEEIIEVPLAALLDERCVRRGSDIVDGEAIETYFYEHGGRVIWGATARMLRQFLGIVCEIEPQG